METRWYALQLTLVCVVVFVIQVVAPVFTELFVLDARAFVQPWRFVSAIFLHGSLAHLLYNGFALALFGTLLESTIGSRRFLLVFLIAGVLANGVSVFLYESALGASGAIFGVIGTLVVLQPGLMVWAFGLPMPLALAGVLWALGDLIGIFVPSNIANIAHLTGMAIGLFLGFFYRNPNRKQRNTMRFDEQAMRHWEDRYVKDPELKPRACF